MTGRVPDEQIDRRHIEGPFDIIGDVHGCADELIDLLGRLGYTIRLDGTAGERRVEVSAPEGRRVVFVGDFVDRGPRSPDVLRIAMAMVADGLALAVPGNHDAKLMRWLEGRMVRLTNGLEATVAQLAAEPPDFHDRVRTFIAGLPSHLLLDGGRLAVTHAGIPEHLLGQSSARVRSFCLYGDTDGETDGQGLPVRYDWAAEYRGHTAIIYGHTPIDVATWRNRTLCIDTGCVFGGRLTALRWPECDLIAVNARAIYANRRHPFGHPPSRPAKRS